MPQSNEVTDVLKKFNDIAAADARDSRGLPVDPVLEYDTDKILHIVDPFAALRLRWGPSVLGEI